MRFEISNPHDALLMDADDLEVAAVAVWVLGNGFLYYGLKGLGESEGSDMPVLLLGDADAWAMEKFATPATGLIDRVFTQKAVALVAALKSVRLRNGGEVTSTVDLPERAARLVHAIGGLNA